MKTIPRIAFLFQLVLLSLVTALPNGIRSMAVGPAGTELYLNERGEVDGDLYNENGEMKRDIRINLQSRQNPSFNFGGSTKVRGVNIGGWLVAEPWITPSIFDNTGNANIVDEWTLGKYDPSNSCNILESHWSSFITQSDFQQIAAANLNFVRIPIGYWAIDSDHAYYCKGSQLSKLQNAVNWARTYGIKVMIDLHGAVGSQNGFDNSGKKGPLNWFTQSSYETRTKAVIQTLASTFAQDTDTVVIIELLNEPLTTSGPSNALSFTNNYYNDAYYTARYPSGSTPSNYAIAIHDGFQPLSYWANKFQPPTYQQVILDTHIYTVFSQQQVALSQSARASYYCGLKSKIATSNTHLYTLVGEWTMAPTDCAKYLNGRGVGARYDGSYPGSSYVGSCTGMSGPAGKFSTAYKAYLKNMFDSQRKAYESGIGWIMWTWKTEQAGDWDYQRGLKFGYITRNLNSNSAC